MELVSNNHECAIINFYIFFFFFTLRAALDQNLLNDDAFLYEESPELLRFRTAAPSIELLTDWYQNRAEDIEHYSRQVFTADHREIRITSCSEAAAKGIWCVFNCQYPVEGPSKVL